MTTRIMLVDDAAFIRVMLKDILAANRLQVVAEASNGAEAVAMYKRWKPNLVMMDITMPVMDGIDALKEIKKFDPRAKVIISSAMSQQQMVIQAVTAGAVDFIVKPFQKERVLDAVRRVLRE